MKKIVQITLNILLFACIAFAAIATVKADTAVSVYIQDPTNPANGAKGVSCSGYWVGEIPITITGDSTQAYKTVGYCINFDQLIHIGSTYSATIAPAVDTAEWRSASYLLTWNYPTNNSQGAAAQVAVWRLLNQTRGINYYIEPWMNLDIDNAGNLLAAQAVGKDVVRQDDNFQWISPVTGNASGVSANSGETVTFTVQLTNSTGAPRANVRVLFNATLSFEEQTEVLNSTYVSSNEAFTDSEGLASLDVTVPADTPYGATVEVKAQTQSIWVQRYINTDDPATQNLLGIGETYQLTLSTNVCVLGYITVLPESPLGAIAAIGAFAAGFAVWVKIKKYHKPNP